MASTVAAEQPPKGRAREAGPAQRSAVTILLPAISKDVHAPVAQLQWAVTGYSLVGAAVIVTSGALGDVLGPAEDLPGRARQHPEGTGVDYLEPGIYLPDRFGVRIEHIVVAADNGGRRLNNTRHEMRIVS